MRKIDIAAVQAYLKELGLDGWLLFDFRGQNYIATSLLSIPEEEILTRRWFYFIPQKGQPALLLHKIERNNFPEPPEHTECYISWRELQDRLKAMLRGRKKIAMEYSPGCAIPYVSCVDGGTLEMVRQLGVEVVTSADLVQYFQSRWNDEQLETHKKAAHIVNRVKDEAFSLVGSRIKNGEAISELDVQRFILEAFDKEKMVTDEPPIVAVNANASNPHYAPSPERFSPIRKGDLLLIDLFGKLNVPDAIFADITWMGFVGQAPEEKHVKVFDIVKNGRDAGLHLLQEAARAGRAIQGWEVDARVRQVIQQAGYGDAFHHRTGHSLDTNLHGNGVNLDSLETQDQRQIIPGVGFTIEPGIYLEEFGVRSEINVFYSATGPEVFGPIQEEILKLL